jgi:hypothetical protein
LYPLENAVKNPRLGLWIGSAPGVPDSRMAQDRFRCRGETIQPRLHFLIASRRIECR